MTLAEQFRQEGRQEGYQKGRADGLTIAEQLKQEGKLEAFKTVALKLFGQGMSFAQVAEITGLSIQEAEQLKSKSSNLS